MKVEILQYRRCQGWGWLLPVIHLSSFLENQKSTNENLFKESFIFASEATRCSLASGIIFLLDPGFLFFSALDSFDSENIWSRSLDRDRPCPLLFL